MARFIVNPGGAVHPVGEGDFERLLARKSPSRQGQRYREANREEIAAWYAGQGLAVPAEFLPPSEKLKPVSTGADESKDASGSPVSDLSAASGRGRARKGSGTGSR